MIGIIGDNHWGASYNLGKIDPETQLNTRLLDYSNTFNSIIDKFIERGVRNVFLTGDVFETRHPTSAQLNAFAKCADRAISMGVNIIVSVGNHDQLRNIKTTTMDVFGQLQLPGLKVFQEMGVYHIDEESSVILMPFRDKRMLQANSPEEAIEQLREELNGHIDSLGERNKIVVGHYMLEQGPSGMYLGGTSINELKLPFDMFKKCDAVIMGHIHQPEVIKKTRPVIMYSGSMERNSFGDRGHDKISIIMDEKNTEDFEILNTKCRDLFEISLDYSGTKTPYENEINNQIIGGISNFNNNSSLTDSIVRVVVSVHDADMNYIDQAAIKNSIISMGANFCSSVRVSSSAFRQLRNSSINESVAGKQAFVSYIKNIKFESDAVRKQVAKLGEEIIDKVEVKG